MSIYIKKPDVNHPTLNLNVNGNKLLSSENDIAVCEKLFSIVSLNRNSFFTILNRSENVELAEWAKSKVPALVQQNKFTPNWGTICHWIFNGLIDFPKCPVCGNTYGDTKNVSVGVGYGRHCSNRCKMLDLSVRKRISETCMKKYGVDWSSKSRQARQAYVETCRKKYGCDNAFQLGSSKEKAKSTNLERYGDENYRNTEQRTETCRRLYGQGSNGKAISEARLGASEEEKEEWTKNVKRSKLSSHGDENYNNRGRAIKTCMEKYGVPNAVQSEKSRRKSRETLVSRLGCDHAWKSPDVREKMKIKHFEKYGVEYPPQREDVQGKIKQAKIDRFGMPCSPSYRYAYDGKSFDSSWELAFYIWLKDNGVEFKYPAGVTFDYFDSSGKKHVYVPDFKVGDKIIEIKGNQFLDDNRELTAPYRGKLSDEQYAKLRDIASAKYDCMAQNEITIYSREEIDPYLRYVSGAYGKNFLASKRSSCARRPPPLS